MSICGKNNSLFIPYLHREKPDEALSVSHFSKGVFLSIYLPEPKEKNIAQGGFITISKYPFIFNGLSPMVHFEFDAVSF
jgi:hypothetical protein